MKPSRQQGIEHLRPKCIDASDWEISIKQKDNQKPLLSKHEKTPQIFSVVEQRSEIVEESKQDSSSPDASKSKSKSENKSKSLNGN